MANGPFLRRAARLWARGLTRRCPRCGAGGLFDRWVRMVEECPRCALRFERAEGYWLGAIAINTLVTQLVIVTVGVGVALATWPDPPWGRIAALLVLVGAGFPVLFHPLSRTWWLAFDMTFRAEDRVLTGAADAG